MSVFQYKAVPIGGGPERRGRMPAQTAAELRVSLARLGLQVTEMRPVRPSTGGAPFKEWLHAYLRGRRQQTKAEVFDALSTMLKAGLPITEALSSLGGDGGPLDHLAVSLRSSVNAGEDLASAAAAEPGWFDAVEVEMIRAGESSGTLDAVLDRLSDRQTDANELSSKLIAILSYPAIVLCVGIGVVIFLSSRTLPDLVVMLSDAGVEPPGLTVGIITLGQVLLHAGPWLLIGLPLGGVLTRLVLDRSPGISHAVERVRDRLTPRAFRQIRVASAFRTLSELLVVGVPLVEALRVVTMTSGGKSRLASLLSSAADKIAAGASFSELLDARGVFDTTTQRLVHIGETAGELPGVLASIADRETRKARRSIDALSRIAEPAVVLVLAAVIGIVVMGAVLPLIKLQEIIQ